MANSYIPYPFPLQHELITPLLTSISAWSNNSYTLHHTLSVGLPLHHFHLPTWAISNHTWYINIRKHTYLIQQPTRLWKQCKTTHRRQQIVHYRDIVTLWHSKRYKIRRLASNKVLWWIPYTYVLWAGDVHVDSKRKKHLRNTTEVWLLLLLLLWLLLLLLQSGLLIK